nr:Predicted transcriptional regulators (HipB) [uncultured Mediterranean phage uvMED]|tara:strand:- start:1222 stop:1422 length:201 start_codon:yes stop_codon:yes gene_type:complete
MRLYEVKLSQYLVKNGISQKELSDLLKVSQPTIHKWLYGKSLPSAKKMLAIHTFTKGKVNLQDWKM